MSATIFRYSKASVRWLYACGGIFTRSCTYTDGSGGCVVLLEMLMLLSNSSLDGGQKPGVQPGAVLSGKIWGK